MEPSLPLQQAIGRRRHRTRVDVARVRHYQGLGLEFRGGRSLEQSSHIECQALWIFCIEQAGYRRLSDRGVKHERDLIKNLLILGGVPRQ